VHAALRVSGFTRVTSFGQPAPTGPVGQGTSLQVEAIEPQYPPVEIFQAADPADRPGGPAVMLPAGPTTLVDGGPASLLQLTGQGLLGPGQPAVIAGQDTAADPPAVRQVVTDGPRRADTAFGLPNDNTSYTYTATGTIPPDNPQGAGGQAPRQLLPAGTADHQTVAVLTGAASVTASSAGSWLWEVPQGDPANAFDGNPATAWTEASPVSAAGQWLQVNFSSPRRLSGQAAIRLLDDIPRPVATRLVVTTAAGRAVTAARVTAAAQPLRIPPGTSGWLRITIDAARGGTPGGPGAGIADVSIPGVRVTSYLQPSQDQAGPEPSFSFQREAGAALGLPGDPPEASLNRTFTTPAAARFGVSADVTAVPGAALNALVDRLGAATPAQLRVSATSTFANLPALRPQNLLDGTGWIAAGPSATVSLRWKGQRTVSEIQLTPATVGIAAEPTHVLITSPAGVRDVPVPSSGVLRFPPLVTDQLDVSFPGVMPTTAYNPLVGSAQQLPVGLGSLTVPALASLSTGIPAATTPFRLACGQGPPLTVDGRTYPTSVSGTVRDLINRTPLPLHLCTGGAALALPAGRHSLSSPGTGVPLAVTGLSLTDAAATPASATQAGATQAAATQAGATQAGTTQAATTQAATTQAAGIRATGIRATAAGAAPASRSLRIVSWGTADRTATIGPGGLSYLEVHQTVNPGWTATLNGRRLAPVTLDGWQQAYVVPAGAGGKVVMTFTPETGYHWLLGGAALALCVLIAGALWPPRRRRARTPAPRHLRSVAPGESAAPGERTTPGGTATFGRTGSPGDAAPFNAPGSLGGTGSPGDPGSPGGTGSSGGTGGRAESARLAGYWLAAAGAALALALAGGPVAIAVPAVILLGWWRRQWVPWLAFAAMCVAGAFVIAGLNHGVQPGFGPFGWPAQAAALIALTAALVPAVPRPRRRPPAGALATAEDDK
jgi:arabinofuranan 3-O-arabinosyltransferase